MSDVALIADGLHFPEGPRWRDGKLYVSDFYERVVTTYDERGTRAVLCEVPNQPSGLGFTPVGDLLIVSMLDRRLLLLRDGELTEFADLSPLAPGPCNDMLVDDAGRAWIGNFGEDLDSAVRETVLLRVDPDGSVAVAADGLVFPNGTVITPDGTMIVAGSFAFRISAFDVGADGMLSNRRIWAQFGAPPAADVPAVLATDAFTPDGTCLDSEGGLWVADAQGTGAVRMLEGGEITDRVELDGLTAFACTLGGDDGRTLFLAAGPPLGVIEPSVERRGALLAARVEVPGGVPR
jgi:sugar lactone lactonase YvrE